MRFTAKIPEEIFLHKTYKRVINKWNYLPSTGRPKMPNEIVYKASEQYNAFLNGVKIPNKPMEVHFYGLSNSVDNNCFLVSVKEKLIPVDSHLIFDLLESGFNLNDKKLPGEYIFIKFNNEIKLIKVDSPPYYSALEQIEKAKLKPIKTKELVVGQVYETAVGNKSIFLGYVNTESARVVKSKEEYKLLHKEENLVSLWFSLRGSDLTKKEIQEKLNVSLTNKILWPLSVKNKHSYCVKSQIGQIEVPYDVILICKRNANSYCSTFLEKSDFRPSSKKRSLYEVKFLASLSRLLNMVPYGTKPTSSAQIKKVWENFSEK